jgi:hypothetical protein
MNAFCDTIFFRSLLDSRERPVEEGRLIRLPRDTESHTFPFLQSECHHGEFRPRYGIHRKTMVVSIARNDTIRQRPGSCRPCKGPVAQLPRFLASG